MVLSPKSLWQSYNRKLMPLETSEIRSRESEHGTEKYVYFNGEATAMGSTRIYARVLEPKQKTDKCVVVMLEPGCEISSVDFSALTDAGYAVIVSDYAGDRFDRQRFTMYPAALDFANYNEEEIYSMAETPQKTCWYVWTTVGLRTLTFAESLGYTRIAMLGVGIGGSHVFRVAALSSLPICAVSVFSPGFFPSEDSSETINITASIDLYGYAPLLKVPFLQVCCSNDSDSSLDEISELHDQTGGRSLLYISPRSDRLLNDAAAKNILMFIESYLGEKENFDKNNIRVLAKTTSEIMSIGDPNANESEYSKAEPPIVLNANGSEKKLYFSLKCNQKISNAVLYVSHGITNPSYRNWRVLPLEKAGEDEYIGCTEVYSSDKPIFSFASVTTEGGFTFSSHVLRKIPSQLQIMPTTIAKRRLIYESDMGIDDFFSVGSAPALTMKKGPFDISGICSKQVMCTYKIGDATYSGSRDGVLQLMLFSPVNQVVKFSVTDGEQFNTYSYEQAVSPDSDWMKIMIPASSLKSSDGMFDGWDKAIYLRIDSQEEIIISSLLWV